MGLPRIRPPDEVYKANRLLEALKAHGLELFPLGVRSKMPRDRGFLLRSYEDMRWAPWLKQFGNVGVRARASDLIIDVDPKNGGLESLSALQWDADDDFERYARTLTGRGNGGIHLYMAKPPEVRLRWHLKGYPGIDFQTLGRYVVAPGSVHPETGLLYAWDERGGLGQDAPAQLLKLLAKAAPKARTGIGGDMLTVSDVAECLAALNAADFGAGGKHHDEWLDIAMACHEASDGEALDEWLAWCATDSQYGDDATEMNSYRWESFDSTNRGSDAITYKTLLQAVSRAGHRSLVARLGRRLPASEEHWDEEDAEEAALKEWSDEFEDLEVDDGGGE
jgi:hypothetical protein